MMAVACALAELQRGWYALLNGFPAWLAAVHLDSARANLRRAEYPARLGETTIVTAWKLTDDLADAVRAELPGDSPAFCTCIDNREARHEHGAAGCVVAGCACRATGTDGAP